MQGTATSLHVRPFKAMHERWQSVLNSRIGCPVTHNVGLPIINGQVGTGKAAYLDSLDSGGEVDSTLEASDDAALAVAMHALAHHAAQNI